MTSRPLLQRRSLHCELLEVRTPLAIIGGTAWHDENVNGVNEAAEPGIYGAAVELLDPVDGIVANGNDISLATTITGASGHYEFEGVDAGEYYLQFRTPIGYVFTLERVGGDDIANSDVNAADGRTTVFTVAAADSSVSASAGLVGVAPNFGVVLTIGAERRDVGRGIAVDDAGNMVVVGDFFDTVDVDAGVGEHNLTSHGNGQNDRDAFVSKYSSAGALIWSFSLYSSEDPSAQQAFDVAVDTAGDVYVTGKFRNTVDFDPGPNTYPLTSNGRSDVFVAKYSSTGTLTWARSFGSSAVTGGSPESGQDHGYNIALDVDGGVVTTGDFTGTVDFDPGPGEFALTSVTDADSFILKLNSDGTFLWARSVSGPTFFELDPGVAVGETGSVYTAGMFKGTIDFDLSQEGADTLVSSSGEFDAYVMKTSASGDFAWVHGIYGEAIVQGWAVTVDNDENIYTAGTFTSNVTFGEGSDARELIADQSSNVYVAKYNEVGSLLWVRQIGVGGTGLGVALDTDGRGNVYATGYFSGTADLNPGPGVFRATSIEGEGDMFVTVLDTNGEFIWAMTMGGRGLEHPFDVTVHSSGDVYLTGFFEGAADFHPGGTSLSVNSVGDRDVFVARLLPPGTIGDFVWRDEDGNGAQDQDEPGLANVTVDLFGDDGRPFRTVITDSDGRFRFVGVPAGDYTIGFDRPIGYRFTAQNQAADEGLDSDADPLTGRTAVIELLAGELELSIDAGLIGTGSIQGTKWNDVNANGVRDAGESGLEGWTIYLDQNGNGQFDLGESRSRTDANGGFEFLALSPGLYAVGEERRVCWRRTFPSGQGIHQVSLAAGEAITGVDFGNVSALPGDINGDSQVDLDDLAIFQSYFGTSDSASVHNGDLDGDGAVTRTDARLLAANFGRIACPTPLSFQAADRVYAAHTSNFVERNVPQQADVLLREPTRRGDGRHLIARPEVHKSLRVPPWPRSRPENIA